MTREEFMEHAEQEIDAVLRTNKNRLMNLVMQAWAEGKKNAEINGVVTIVKDALEKLETRGTFWEPRKESVKMSPCDECACIGNSFCCIEDGKPNPEKCMLINGGNHEGSKIPYHPGA